MRGGCTLLGCAVVPFCFLTVWNFTHSLTASSLAACFLIFDIGVLILNRYILLDHILLLFIYFIYLSLQFHSINIPGLGVIVLAHVCMNMI